MAYEKDLYYNFFFVGIKKKNESRLICLWSRLVAVDALVLLHPAPPQLLNVFGSEPAISRQGGLSQAQRQQPADRATVSHVPLTQISAWINSSCTNTVIASQPPDWDSRSAVQASSRSNCLSFYFNCTDPWSLCHPAYVISGISIVVIINYCCAYSTLCFLKNPLQAVVVLLTG